MSHQGNALLGYNLAILVEPKREVPMLLPEGMGASPSEQLSALVGMEILNHLAKRFCKEHENEAKKKGGAASEVLNRHVSLYPYSTAADVKNAGDEWRPCLEESWENRPAEESSERGHVFVFTEWGEGDPEREENRDEKWRGRHARWQELRRNLQRADPEIRIEEFTIAAPANSNDCVDLSDERAPERLLYHIASRVCSALVEYRSELRRPGDDNPDGAAMKVVEVGELLKPGEFLSPAESPLALRNDAVKKILDVEDAIDLVGAGLDGADSYFPPVPGEMEHIFRGKHVGPTVRARYKFPFGVWFRGTKRVCYGLSPSLFRQARCGPLHKECKKLGNGRPPMYDETSMVKHFRLHNAEMRTQQKSTFEWLCLMQHYGMPTRVLDWGENILTALYFVVCKENGDDVDCDGALWVLNAGRLNELNRISTARRYACSPTSADVILRSALSCSRSVGELRARLKKEGQLDYVLNAIKNGGVEREKMDQPDEGHEELADWIEASGNGEFELGAAYGKLGCPVAVFPNRTNVRLNSQLGTFTVHGGKVYDAKIIDRDVIKTEMLLPPRRSLVELHLEALRRTDAETKADGGFLDMYVVPSGAKRKIREQLKRIGIHGASLFPELEHQAAFIQNQWRMDGGDAWDDRR